MNASGSDSLLDLDMQEEQDVFFTIAKLPVDAKFDVVYYASNQKGKSVEKHLTAFTLPMISGEKGTGWIFFGSVKELKESQCSSVRPSGPSLSRAPNLHLSGFGLSQVSLRSLLGLS